MGVATQGEKRYFGADMDTSAIGAEVGDYWNGGGGDDMFTGGATDYETYEDLWG